jgi:hypothetical protein
MSARPAMDGARGVRLSVVLLALLCLGIGGIAGYEFRGTPEQAPSYLAQLTDSLGLRPDQVARLETVLAAEDRDIDELLKGRLRELDPPVTARRRQTEQALLAVLDDSQRAHYEQLLHAGAAGTPGAADGERGR